ncbi:unnamed protein product, partial [Aphanomyces euteiches]
GALSMKDTMSMLTAVKMSDESKFPSVLHMFPKHEHKRPYRGAVLTFASSAIAQKVYDKLQASCHGNLMSILFK